MTLRKKVHRDPKDILKRENNNNINNNNINNININNINNNNNNNSNNNSNNNNINNSNNNNSNNNNTFKSSCAKLEIRIIFDLFWPLIVSGNAFSIRFCNATVVFAFFDFIQQLIHSLSTFIFYYVFHWMVLS